MQTTVSMASAIFYSGTAGTRETDAAFVVARAKMRSKTTHAVFEASRLEMIFEAVSEMQRSHVPSLPESPRLQDRKHHRPAA